MNRRKLLALALAVSLLCGCGAAPSGTDGPGGQTDAGAAGSTLTVYAPSAYHYALQQAFSRIAMADAGVQLQWADSQEEAQVVFTDCVTPETYDSYMVLGADALQTQGLQELLLCSDEGVIGLPVFLRLDGLWYNKSFYSAYGMQVPQSAEAWAASGLNERYPAVCGTEDVMTLFWALAAPLYLGAGGTAQELSAGALRYEPLADALGQLETLVRSGMLVMTDDARQRFIGDGAQFFVADVGELAKYYNYKSNLAQWALSPAVPFASQEQPQCIVRAELLLIKKTADPEAAQRFINLFYENSVLADLSDDTRLPMACRLQYAPSAVPELAQTCYTALSSPSVTLNCITCAWSGQCTQAVQEALGALLDGRMDAAQAAEYITK